MNGYAIHEKWRGLGFDFYNENLKLFIRQLPKEAPLRRIFLGAENEFKEENQHDVQTQSNR